MGKGCHDDEGIFDNITNRYINCGGKKDNDNNNTLLTCWYLDKYGHNNIYSFIWFDDAPNDTPHFGCIEHECK